MSRNGKVEISGNVTLRISKHVIQLKHADNTARLGVATEVITEKLITEKPRKNAKDNGRYRLVATVAELPKPEPASAGKGGAWHPYFEQGQSRCLMPFSFIILADGKLHLHGMAYARDGKLRDFYTTHIQVVMTQKGGKISRLTTMGVKPQRPNVFRRVVGTAVSCAKK